MAKLLDENSLRAIKEWVLSGLSGKQNTLVWDTTPTQGSTKPVTSGGIYTAIKNAVAGVYRILGTFTVDEVNAMGSSDLTVGDVINVSDAGTITLGSQSVAVLPGDNIVWLEGGMNGYFDKLAGIVDLSDYVTNSSLATTLNSYVTKTFLNTTLGSYVTNNALTTQLASYKTIASFNTDIANYYNKTQTDNLLAGKQATLVGSGTGQNIKTINNTNILGTGNISIPVITVDSSLSSTSTNPVQNKVINSALAGKQNTLTFDNSPTQGSTNPVTSGGVYTAIQNAISSVFVYKGSVSTYNNLPTAGLVKGDVYNVEDTGDNYVWDGSAWDKLAGTVDLSSYATKTYVNNALSSYVTSGSLATTLESYVTLTYLQSNVYGKNEVDTLLNAKQNKLTFDSTPTANSNNPVYSKGIKTYVDNGLSGKQNTLTFDNTPTANSDNPVKSQGIKSYVDTAVGNTLSYADTLASLQA